MSKQEILKWLIEITEAARWAQDAGDLIYLERLINRLHEELYDAEGESA